MNLSEAAAVNKVKICFTTLRLGGGSSQHDNNDNNYNDNDNDDNDDCDDKAAVRQESLMSSSTTTMTQCRDPPRTGDVKTRPRRDAT